jgi:D-alanine-D-alanine ligase
MTEKVGAIAKRAYELLRMKGFSRTEFIIVDNEPFMLEMNTVQVWRQKVYFRNNL